MIKKIALTRFLSLFQSEDDRELSSKVRSLSRRLRACDSKLTDLELHTYKLELSKSCNFAQLFKGLSVNNTVKSLRMSTSFLRQMNNEKKRKHFFGSIGCLSKNSSLNTLRIQQHVSNKDAKNGFKKRRSSMTHVKANTTLPLEISNLTRAIRYARSLQSIHLDNIELVIDRTGINGSANISSNSNNINIGHNRTLGRVRRRGSITTSSSSSGNENDSGSSSVDTDLEIREFAEVLEGCPKLTTFELERVTASVNLDPIIIAIAKSDTIEAVTLSSCHKTRTSNNDNNIFSGPALALLLREAKTLKSLKATNLHLDQEDAHTMVQGLEGNTTLEHLDLHLNTSLEMQDGMSIVRMLQPSENSSLLHLNLSSTKLSDSVGIALANALQHNTKLRLLDVSWNELGDKFCFAMCHTLETNHSLKHLRMDENTMMTSYGYNFFEHIFLQQNHTHILETLTFRCSISDYATVAWEKQINFYLKVNGLLRKNYDNHYGKSDNNSINTGSSDNSYSDDGSGNDENNNYQKINSQWVDALNSVPEDIGFRQQLQCSYFLIRSHPKICAS